MKNLKKGFTLIELLVVVAIIGILASVVLASLNTARAKGANAAVKANLANARAQAEIFYDSNTAAINTYTGVCTTGPVGGVNGIGANIDAAEKAGGAKFCYATATTWAASATLKAGDPTGFWCVDSAGGSRGISLQLSGTPASCPAS